MTIKTYAEAKANLANLCDEVTKSRESVIIKRKGQGDIALIAADELAGLLETLHLLQSPKNATRLFTALDRAKQLRSIIRDS